MTQPLVSAIAAGRSGRRVAGAGLLVLLIVAWLVGPAGADDQPDPYSATVKVDATADSAASARTVARTDGQRHALDEVVKGLERHGRFVEIAKARRPGDHQPRRQL